MRRRPAYALLLASVALALAAPLSSPADPVSDARDDLLGPGWNDPAQVRLRWFGVTNFIASFGGRVVLLDGWVIEGAVSGHVPITVQDLIAVDPDYIYVGHSHFDHTAHAGQIAEATGAKVVGTTEHCQVIKRDAADPSRVACVSIVDSDGVPFSGGGPFPGMGPAATPPGRVGTPSEGPSGLGVAVVMSKHSAGRFPDPSDPREPAGPPPEPGVIAEHPPGPLDFAHFAERAGDAEAGTLAYRFTWGDLTILWHDSTGPVSSPGEAGAAEIKAALTGLGDIDVQIGAIMGFNQLTNGLKDPREYIEAATPKVFIPSHHDNWAPPITTRGANYYDIVVDELGRIPEASRPELCFITDPENYADPIVLTTTDWAGSSQGVIANCWTPPPSEPNA